MDRLIDRDTNTHYANIQENRASSSDASGPPLPRKRAPTEKKTKNVNIEQTPN